MGYQARMHAAVLSLFLAPVVAGARPGVQARFLGWNPDSSDFAYVLTTVRRTGPPREAWFMKGVSPTGRAVGKACKGPVGTWVRTHGYRAEEVRGQRVSDYVYAFDLGGGRTVRVVLEVGAARLTYSVWLDDVERPGDSERLLRGYFDELWTEFAARLYLAPDRRWAAVVIDLGTPYRTDAWVEGVRLARAGAPR